MVMTSELVEEVKRRSLDERVRRAYPAGFPELPPVPAARYADASFAALEREAVFGRSWLMVAHVDELPHPGDYRLVGQLPQPIAIVRGQDDRIRAFYNTCKHRGAALLVDPAGNTGRRMTCPYHSWSYSLEGELAGYPDAHNFTDLDRDCLSLSSIRCETWGPLIFVNLDPHAVPLLEFLAPVSQDLSEIAGLEGRLHLAHHTVREAPCNWKLPVDANIETYHVNTVHRNSAGRALEQSATGIQLLRNGHSRMLIRFQEHVAASVEMPFPSIVNGVGDLASSGTFSYHVFPNLSIVFFGGGFLFFITNWPTTASTSTYHVHWCSSVPPTDDAGRTLNRTFVDMNEAVLFEDLSVLPGMQQSIDAGAIDSLTLSYQERRIYHVHEAIDRAIGVERIPNALRVAPVLGPFTES